jgi:hypothetical protein
VFGGFHARGGEVELKSFRVAMNEIEDAMSAGVHPCNQVRPSDRTLRWDARAKLLEGALLSQAREVGHLPIRHELAEKLRIHPVDAEDDELLVTPPLAARPLARGQQQQRRTRQRCSYQPEKLFQTVTPLYDRLCSPGRGRQHLHNQGQAYVEMNCCAECPRM